ncbi:MAG: DUF411 domain-containing protein [Gemmatimonadota bacterium]
MVGEISRRKMVVELGAAVAALAGLSRIAAGATRGEAMIVYKDPSCGCCGKWIEHVKAAGFTVSVQDTPNMDAIKQRYKVGDALKSCHTAVVGGYVVEGHVPAADIKRLLVEKPKVAGLTIPGMPASAPGMDMTPFRPYDVLAFDGTGKTTVFAKHATA